MSQEKMPKITKDKYTPQQIAFGLRYCLPSSDTFGNAKGSALAAGFNEGYAANITCKNLKWLEDIVLEIVGEGIDKNTLVTKAKRVLKKSMDSADEKLAQDTAKFIAKSTPEYSEKQDITSMGEKLEQRIVIYPKSKV